MSCCSCSAYQSAYGSSGGGLASLGTNVASSLAQNMAASGPIAITGANTFTGVQTTQAKILSTVAYSAVAANVAFGDSQGGISFSSGGTYVSVLGTSRFAITNTDVHVGSTVPLGFASGASDAGNAVSFFMYGGVAGAIQMGAASATPVDQLFKGPNGSGKDIQGGDLRIAPGRSTGVASPAVLALQGTEQAGSGASPQTLVDVLTVASATSLVVERGVTVQMNDVIISSTGAGSNGLKIAASVGELLGFWGTAAVPQPAHIADPTGDAGTGTDTVDLTTLNATLANLQSAVGSINAMLANTGLTAAT